MLNAEKYKRELRQLYAERKVPALDSKTQVLRSCKDTNCINCLFNSSSKNCTIARETWLLEECLITDEEEAFLSILCERYDIENFVKIEDESDGYLYLAACIASSDKYIAIPVLNADDEFAGMEMNKLYTPFELGIL